MKKEIAEKLIDALESGNYTQGRYQLRNGNNFCCLGVLCDIAVKEGIIKKPLKEGREFIYEGEIAFLPESVCQWAGTDREAYFKYFSLVNMNDNGFSFKEIASAIRAQISS